ncbi:MAG: alpha/beta hydrolase [Oscillospiraceae bacterium]|nr:alpha/beta hydrolase [Oscillospiraceae bacterium]
MNRSQVVFKAIDIFGYIPQNITHYKGVACVKDVAFNKSRDKYESGDVYYSEKAMKLCKEQGKKMPVILNIHGGGFVMGDKKCRKSYSSFWAEKGYFVFNINYRLAPKAQFPEYLYDSIDALNYLEELNKYYGTLDLDKIIVMGDSSGGYSAAFVAALAFDDDLVKTLGTPEVKLKPAVLAPFCGIYDIDTLFDNNIFPFKLVDVTAETFLGYEHSDEGIEAIKKYKYVDYISPMKFVNKNWCPTFIVWSNSDIICTNQGQPFYDALVANLGEENVGKFTADGFANNHCFHLNMALKISKQCFKAADEFFREKLKFEDVLAEAAEKEKAEKEEAEIEKAAEKEKAAQADKN